MTGDPQGRHGPFFQPQKAFQPIFRGKGQGTRSELPPQRLEIHSLTATQDNKEMALAPRIAQKKILGDLGIRIKMQALHFFDGIHGIMRNHAVTDARIIQHVQNLTDLSVFHIFPVTRQTQKPRGTTYHGEGKSTPDGTTSYGR